MLDHLAHRALRSMVLVLSLTGAAEAASSSGLRNRGKAVLQDKCGRCHAVGPKGASRLAEAPPLRAIYGRFAPRELRAEIQEGMVSRHRDMPQIEFSDEDTDAIMAYLYWLALRK